LTSRAGGGTTKPLLGTGTKNSNAEVDYIMQSGSEIARSVSERCRASICLKYCFERIRNLFLLKMQVLLNLPFFSTARNKDTKNVSSISNKRYRFMIEERTFDY
jgi:hypothetical protein